MTSVHARASARDILAIVPLVMRTVSAELRAAGELPAPAHFGLLSMLAVQPSALTLTELAGRQGVSLPTMSNTVSAMVARGWIRRSPAGPDRRVVRIEVTARGRATLRRVGRSAEAHIAELLGPLDDLARQRLRGGLEVLLQVFAASPVSRPHARSVSRPTGGRKTRGSGRAKP